MKATGRLKRFSAVLLSLAALTSCGAPPNRIDVSTYPPDMQRRYALFEQRCTRCHEMERPINVNVSTGGWPAYVRRMSKHPAAGISIAEQREISAFLEFHAGKRRPVGGEQ